MEAPMMSHLEPHPTYITQDLETGVWWLVMKTSNGEKFRVQVERMVPPVAGVQQCDWAPPADMEEPSK
jgi:hypothetical protein